MEIKELTITQISLLLKKAIRSLVNVPTGYGITVEVEDVSGTADEQLYSCMINQEFEIRPAENESGEMIPGKWDVVEWVTSGGSYMEPPDVDEREILSGVDATVAIYQVVKELVTRPLEGYFEMYDLNLDYELAQAEQEEVAEKGKNAIVE